MTKIYVASSWGNNQQPYVVWALRKAGHEVYDFRNPAAAFAWSDIDPKWVSWSPGEFRDALDHPIAVDGYGMDYNAMRWADAFVLLMPCGRSAHLEAGYAVGAGKPLVIILSDGEPELMYRLALENGEIVETVEEAINFVGRLS